jgi:hypothetical protein
MVSPEGVKYVALYGVHNMCCVCGASVQRGVLFFYSLVDVFFNGIHERVLQQKEKYQKKVPPKIKLLRMILG